jgi:hypothetical protein
MDIRSTVIAILSAILLIYLINKVIKLYQQYQTNTCKAGTTPQLSVTDSAAKIAFFKFSYMICAIYGSLLVLIALLSYLSNAASNIFLGNYKQFTLTLSGGIIFILIILTYQLMTYKDKKTVVSPYDTDLCPDFWKLAPTDASDAIYRNVTTSQPTNSSLFQMKCVPDTTILQTYRSLMDPTTNAPLKDNSSVGFPADAQINPYGQRIINPSSSNKFTTVDTSAASLSNMNPSIQTGVLNNIVTKMQPIMNANSGSGALTPGNAGANKLVCDQLYPQYLSKLNKNDSDPTVAAQANAYACTYAQACGIPWPSLCGQ